MGSASIRQGLCMGTGRREGETNGPCRCDAHPRPSPFAGSYYLTTTYGALEHIKNYDKITVTRQLSMEVQDSIHRWERRRTLNKARASRSSVQVAGETSQGKGLRDECALSIHNHFKYDNYLNIKSTQITIKREHILCKISKSYTSKPHLNYILYTECILKS